jgi:type I restriction enzyme S subunit
MKPGYKQTEVGIIPEEWDELTISQVFQFKQGVQSPVEQQVHVERVGYKRFIRIVDVTDPSVPWRFISDPGPVHHVAPNDLFMVRYGSPGLLGFGHEGVIANNLFRLIPKKKIAADYYFQYLSSRKGDIAEISGSSTMPAVNFSTLSGLKLVYPPPPEQRAIAEALSDVDGLLGGLDRLIAKKRDLKQAAMQQLLTGQTRLPGFDGKWEVKTLKQAAEINTGINKPVSEMGHGALYVTVQDLYDGTSIRIERLGRIRVSAAEIEARALAVGDIIFGKSSVKRDGIGYPSQFLGAGEPVVFSGFTYRARARLGTADATFLYYALRSSPTRRWLIDNSQASALTNINQRIADAIPVTLPPLPEQTAIASVLTEMDAELAALEQRREKTRALKQAMMQELLTGRTRLV